MGTRRRQEDRRPPERRPRSGRLPRGHHALDDISLKHVEKALADHLPARHQHLLPKNYEALKRGFLAASAVPA